MSCDVVLMRIPITAGDYREVGFTYTGGDISTYVERKLYIEHPSSPGGELVLDAQDVDFTQGQGKFVISRGLLTDLGVRMAEIKLGASASTVATSQKFAFEVFESIGPTT